MSYLSQSPTSLKEERKEEENEERRKKNRKRGADRNGWKKRGEGDREGEEEEEETNRLSFTFVCLHDCSPVLRSCHRLLHDGCPTTKSRSDAFPRRERSKSCARCNSVRKLKDQSRSVGLLSISLAVAIKRGGGMDGCKETLYDLQCNII